MKTPLIAIGLLASAALTTPAMAFSSTVYLDTVELVQLGVTPDQVQSHVGFPLDNNPLSDSQVLSVAYNFDGWTWWTWHQNQSGNDPVWYGTLVESHFPDNPYLKTYWSLLSPDPNNPAMANVEILLCSDDQCTDWIYAYAMDAVPLDGDGFNGNHVLQFFSNPRTGAMDYVLDGNRASLNPGTMPQLVIDASTNYGGNPFSLPVAGVYYTFGCDLIFSDPNYPDMTYKTCIIGNVEEVYFYTGPFVVNPIDPVIRSFYTTSPSGVIQALPLNFGLAVYGELPTIYLGGDINQFPNGNASWFSAQAQPEVLPYAVVPLTDQQGNVGSLQTSVWNPYP